MTECCIVLEVTRNRGVFTIDLNCKKQGVPSLENHGLDNAFISDEIGQDEQGRITVKCLPYTGGSFERKITDTNEGELKRQLRYMLCCAGWDCGAIRGFHDYFRVEPLVAEVCQLAKTPKCFEHDHCLTRFRIREEAGGDILITQEIDSRGFNSGCCHGSRFYRDGKDWVSAWGGCFVPGLFALRASKTDLSQEMLEANYYPHGKECCKKMLARMLQVAKADWDLDERIRTMDAAARRGVSKRGLVHLLLVCSLSVALFAEHSLAAAVHGAEPQNQVGLRHLGLPGNWINMAELEDVAPTVGDNARGSNKGMPEAGLPSDHPPNKVLGVHLEHRLPDGEMQGLGRDGSDATGVLPPPRDRTVPLGSTDEPSGTTTSTPDHEVESDAARTYLETLCRGELGMYSSLALIFYLSLLSSVSAYVAVLSGIWMALGRIPVAKGENIHGYPQEGDDDVLVYRFDGKSFTLPSSIEELEEENSTEPPPETEIVTAVRYSGAKNIIPSPGYEEVDFIAMGVLKKAGVFIGAPNLTDLVRTNINGLEIGIAENQLGSRMTLASFSDGGWTNMAVGSVGRTLSCTPRSSGRVLVMSNIPSLAMYKDNLICTFEVELKTLSDYSSFRMDSISVNGMSSIGGFAMKYLKGQLECVREITEGTWLCPTADAASIFTEKTIKINGEIYPAGNNSICKVPSKQSLNVDCICVSQNSYWNNAIGAKAKSGFITFWKVYMASCSSLNIKQETRGEPSCLGQPCFKMDGAYWLTNYLPGRLRAGYLTEKKIVKVKCLKLGDQGGSIAWTQYGITDVLNSGAGASNMMPVWGVCDLEASRIVTEFSRERVTNVNGKKEYLAIVSSEKLNVTGDFYERAGKTWGSRLVFDTVEGPWFSPAVSKGRAGGDSFRVNNALQRCAESVMENTCYQLMSDPESNDWLTGLYIGLAALTIFYGPLCTLIRLCGQRWEKTWFFEKQGLYRWYAYRFSEDKAMRELVNRMRDGRKKLTAIFYKSKDKTSFSKSAVKGTKYTHHHCSCLSYSEWIDLNNEFEAMTDSRNWRADLFINLCLWFPGYSVCFHLLQSVWFLLAFPIGIIYWFRQRKAKEPSNSDVTVQDSHEEKTLALSKLNTPKSWGKLDNFVKVKKATTSHLKHAQMPWLRKAVFLFYWIAGANAEPSVTVTWREAEVCATLLLAVHLLVLIPGIYFQMKFYKLKNSGRKLAWILLLSLIACTGAVTQTYVINCNGDKCERAIDLDETVQLTQGAQVTIQLRNPKTGLIDGHLNVTVEELNARVTGSYEYSVLPVEVHHMRHFSDMEDCEKCNNPIDWLNGDDFRTNMLWVLQKGLNGWDGKVETTESNDGYCAGAVGFAQKSTSYGGRAFTLGSISVEARMRVLYESPETRYEKVIVSSLDGNTLDLDDHGQISFRSINKPLSQLANQRMICWFSGDSIVTLSDCAIGAEGMTASSTLTKWRGEGERRFASWRGVDVRVDISTSESSCDHCIGEDGKCDCDCTLTWHYGGLYEFNRQDVLSLGSNIIDANCFSKVVFANSSDLEEFGWCAANWLTEDECKSKEGGALWIKGKTRAPGSIAVESTGCSKSDLTVLASFKSEYDAMVEVNYLSASDVTFSMDGCWGENYMMRVKMSTEEAGTLLMSSDTLIVPGLLTLQQGVNYINASAIFYYTSYSFGVISAVDATTETVVLDFTPTHCDTVTEGGDGQDGWDSTGPAAEGSWKIWVIIVAIIIAVLIIIIIACICCKKDKYKTVIEQSSPEKKTV